MTALLSDEDYGNFQSRLAANPGLGSLIKGGGGIRKIRVLAKVVKEEFRDES